MTYKNEISHFFIYKCYEYSSIYFFNDFIVNCIFANKTSCLSISFIFIVFLANQIIL